MAATGHERLGPDFPVVIPAYNEAATIVDVVTRVLKQAESVIVVDDGSTDATAELLQNVGIILLRNETNLGKAATLWRGCQHALEMGAEAVITLDGDGQHRPEDIPRLKGAATAFPGNIIIASRLRKQENAPPLRLFANRFANFWISWAAGYLIADSQSGFRLYPAGILQSVEVNTDRAHSFVFESEILIDAARNNFHSVAVPIESIYPKMARHSHYRPAADTTAIVKMVAWRLLSTGMNPVGLIRVIHHQIQARFNRLPQPPLP